MEQALNVAKEFYREYYDRYNENMDEMKMHKLMYLVQRESLIVNKKVLFLEDFYGWRFGPVLKSVRKEYMDEVPFKSVYGEVSITTKKLVKLVLDRYGTVSSWGLSRLSHNEFSWKCARKGLNATDNGDVKLEINAMKIDAARELSVRRRK